MPLAITIRNPGHKKIWYRVYGDANGNGFSGSDFEPTDDNMDRSWNKHFEIFSWMRWENAETGFEPDGYFPISDGDVVTFTETGCDTSHMVIYLDNTASKQDATVEALYSLDGNNTISTKLAPGGSERWRVKSGVKELIITHGGVTERLDTVFNGQTITFQEGGTNINISTLALKLPVNDIPIKMINRSGQHIDVRVHYDESGNNYRTDYIRANCPPYVMFLPSHPMYVEWSYDGFSSENTQKKQYTKGMSVLVLPKSLGGSGLEDQQVIDFLSTAGLLHKYGHLFGQQDLDYTTLLELTEADLAEMKLPLGPRKKVMKELRRLTGAAPTTGGPIQHPGVRVAKAPVIRVEGTWDLFLSHKQLNGADLACSIKLQLEIKNPELRIFLDVDDLNNVHVLENNVMNSSNFVLILTAGVLERPFVQKEIRAAIGAKKNIILVHDERNCPFPTGDALANVPQDIQQVLAIKAIPYYREKAFRDVCIQQVLAKMVEYAPPSVDPNVSTVHS